MKKILYTLIVFIGIGLVAAYFYGFEKIKRQATALMSANGEYKTGDWKELYAYEVGKEAFIYGYPALYWANIRHRFIEKPENRISMGVNELWQTEIPPLPENKYGGSPNRDTRYSFCWIDLRNEGAIITVPENPEKRYYSIQLVEMYSDIYDYIGLRATKNEPGKYLILGPNHKGEDPKGYKKVFHSPSNWSFIVIRVATVWDDPNDVKLTKTFQDQFKIDMLGENGQVKPTPKNFGRDVMDVFDGKADPLNAIKTMNMAMIENPPPSRDDALMNMYALVGCGSKGTSRPDTLDPAIQKGLRRAVVDAMSLLQNSSIKYASITNQNKTVNQWVWGPKNWGRMAESSDFFGRAGSQCMVGLMEHYIEECVKMRCFNDSKGNPLNGNNKYRMHLSKDQIPHPKAFWSITGYTPEYNLIPNDAKINALGSYSKGLKYNADGSLDIFFQAEKPEDGKSKNWHPIKKGEDFNLFFRSYLPEKSWINQTYVPPGVEKI